MAMNRGSLNLSLWARLSRWSSLRCSSGPKPRNLEMEDAAVGEGTRALAALDDEEAARPAFSHTFASHDEIQRACDVGEVGDGGDGRTGMK